MLLGLLSGQKVGEKTNPDEVSLECALFRSARTIEKSDDGFTSQNLSTKILAMNRGFFLLTENAHAIHLSNPTSPGFAELTHPLLEHKERGFSRDTPQKT